MKLYLHLHDRGMFEKSLNATCIALISKMIRVDLIGSVYKILAMVLSNRLKNVMGELLSKHSICISPWTRERLEKVYDHINWGVLLYMPRRCGFRERRRKWLHFQFPQSSSQWWWIALLVAFRQAQRVYIREIHYPHLFSSLWQKRVGWFLMQWMGFSIKFHSEFGKQWSPRQFPFDLFRWYTHFFCLCDEGLE